LDWQHGVYLILSRSPVRILRLKVKHSLPEKAKIPGYVKILKPGYTTTLQGVLVHRIFWFCIRTVTF
jgi:hypothetical protein